MAKKPSARWSGVIAFPELSLEIDGGLYAAVRDRGRTPLPIHLIHRTCKSRLPGAGDEEDETEEGAPRAPRAKKAAAAEPTAVARQFHCPSCNRAIPSDEVGRAVEARIGLIEIEPEEYAALQPRISDRGEAKVAEARLIQDPTDVLATIGAGRRFYLFPKPISVEAYFRLFAVLTVAKRAGFVQDLVVDRREYTVVIRPMVTHVSVFDCERKLLIVDAFVDTETLRHPNELWTCPAAEPFMTPESITDAVAVASGITKVVDPNACVSPERRRLKELIQRKLTAQRGV